MYVKLILIVDEQSWCRPMVIKGQVEKSEHLSILYYNFEDDKLVSLKLMKMPTLEAQTC